MVGKQFPEPLIVTKRNLLLLGPCYLHALCCSSLFLSWWLLECGAGGLSAVESHGREAASAAGLCAGQTAIRLVAMADRSSSPLITPTHVLSSSSAAGGGGGAQQGSASSSSATTMTLFQELTAIYRTAPWYGEVGFVLSTSFTESV